MAGIALLAGIMAVVWILITGQISWASFGVGYVLGLGVLWLLRPKLPPLNPKRLPRQIIALILYGLILYRDIWLSGLDIARRVLSVDMKLKPGVVAVPTQDTHKSLVIAALSADAISLTPGELVTEIEANSVLYVHTLDVEATAANAAQEQAERLAILNRILGREQA
jgi:multicomponent Na+:H+ antiporter subunit E